MKRRWMAAFGFVGFAVVSAIAAAGLAGTTRSRMARTWDVEPTPIDVPTGDEAMIRGGHLASMICANCHGPDLGGTTIFDDPTLARIDAPNLTPGRGSSTAGYLPEDWVRAIRHGIGRDRTALLIMPSADFQHLSQTDLAALVAYLQVLPPVDHETEPITTTFFGRVLVGAGAFGEVLDAEVIEHGATTDAAFAPGSVDHGAYLVATLGCRGCHGQSLTGGKDPNPEAPRGPDLTSTGALANWTEAAFVEAMRTGRTPDGRVLSEFMPYETLGRADDVELHALWTYLRSM